ncbi:MAG: DUF4783 domain-containing protein [Cyclobacteriaceae bacterium]
MLKPITLFIFTCVLFFMSTLVVKSQEIKDDYGIAVALEEGSSKAISSYFDEMVEISLGKDKRDFSKNQAEVVLGDFFDNYQAKSFELRDQRQSNENFMYLTGIYQSNNDVFKVLIKGKKFQDEQFVIYSMDFLKE